MNPGDILQKDAFEQFVVVFVPGFTALAPYPFVAACYFDGENPWSGDSIVFGLVYLVISVAVGLVIEGFGGWIESCAWDRLLSRSNAGHSEQWGRYLQLPADDELIGHRYLRTKVTAMKFDHGLAIALLLAWPGLLWLQALESFWSSWLMIGSTLTLFGLVGYLFFDAYQTAKILAKVRSLILEVVKEKGGG